MPERIYNVLFLCTGNSARSILAEAILNARGAGRFHAFSAGSHPKGAVHPLALEILERHRLPMDGLRSKGWDKFAEAGAPAMDFVFTVCDDAAGEMCPVWPGQPMTAHWGIPDPAAATGTQDEQRKAFRDAFSRLSVRLSYLLALPIERLDRLTLRRELEQIGRTEERASAP